MTSPRESDHIWRCNCGGGHFLSVYWYPADEHEDGTAEVSGAISLEGDFWPTLRDRLAAAWRVLRHGHALHGVSVALDPQTAREIAGVLVDYSDLADPLRDHGPVPEPPAIDERGHRETP